MDRIGPMWTEQNLWTEWIGYNQCGPNRTGVDIIGAMWIEWTNRTNVDEIEPKWTENEKMDGIGPKWTELNF